MGYRFGKGYFKIQGLILQPAAIDPSAQMHCVHKESKAWSSVCKGSVWTTGG